MVYLLPPSCMEQTHEFHQDATYVRRDCVRSVGLPIGRCGRAEDVSGVAGWIGAWSRGVVGGQQAPVAKAAVLNLAAVKAIDEQTKMGQLPVAIDPFVNLVAGTGFEPVTFGL